MPCPSLVIDKVDQPKYEDATSLIWACKFTSDDQTIYVYYSSSHAYWQEMIQVAIPCSRDINCP